MANFLNFLRKGFVLKLNYILQHCFKDFFEKTATRN